MFFFKQPSCYGSNVKNELKVKQLAKQPPTLKMLMQKNWSLTLPVLCISQSCIEMWINLNFCFHTSLWCLKRFYEERFYQKPFEALQGSVKIKIQVNFSYLSGIGTGGVKSLYFWDGTILILVELDNSRKNRNLW